MRIYNSAVQSFRVAYRESEEASERTGWAIGERAMQKLSDQVGTERVTPAQRGFMVFFSLKLGARRGLDFTNFFRQRSEKLKDLKTGQARIFGGCQTYAVDRRWTRLIESLKELGDVEEQFRQELFR